MNYYLIDYENLTENGLKGVESLTENDCVDIFYSQNQDKISFGMHLVLCSAKAKINFHKVASGTKNALDFQLATYLGYLISKNENDAFRIISKDNGYKAVASFWENADIKLCESIRKCAETVPTTEEIAPVAESTEEVIPQREKPVIKKPKKRPVKVKVQEETIVPDPLHKQVARLFGTSDVSDNVYNIIVKYKTKQGVNNAIVKKYGTEKAGDIYKKIKPLIKDKKGN